MVSLPANQDHSAINVLLTREGDPDTLFTLLGNKDDRFIISGYNYHLYV